MISRSRHLVQISCGDAFESESTWIALRAGEKNHPNSYAHWSEEQCCMRCPALLHLKHNSDASPTSTRFALCASIFAVLEVKTEMVYFLQDLLRFSILSSFPIQYCSL